MTSSGCRVIRACVVTASPLTLNRPAAPGSPPKMPCGALGQPARHGVELPRPGRVDAELDRLAEPAGLRAGAARAGPQRLGRNRIGADASTTSIGTAATPVGYEQASRPDFVARAPTPPA